MCHWRQLYLASQRFPGTGKMHRDRCRAISRTAVAQSPARKLQGRDLGDSRSFRALAAPAHPESEQVHRSPLFCASVLVTSRAVHSLRDRRHGQPGPQRIPEAGQ